MLVAPGQLAGIMPFSAEMAQGVGFRANRTGDAKPNAVCLYIRRFFATRAILLSVSRWCTVTVTDPDGRRHSLDLLADSTYDAAHLFVVEAKKERAVGLPKPTLATVFEVIANGKVYRVAGMALQRWIVQRRQSLNGPKGYMFSKRPGLE
jgi:hypothetical protein